MKILIATILLVGSMNTFAACSAGGACDKKEECEALSTPAKKLEFQASDKTCKPGGEQSALPDCKFVYDGNGEKKEGGTGAPATGPASSGKGL